MLGSGPLPLISDFVDRARAADDYDKVQRCVDEGLAGLRSVDVSQGDAIHMLTTAIVSNSKENEADAPNLFQVFVELERRKPPTTVDILPLLSSTGSLPLAEMTMRSGASAERLLRELQFSVEQGLIEVEDGLPNKAEDLRTDRRRVRLTVRGTRRAFP